MKSRGLIIFGAASLLLAGSSPIRAQDAHAAHTSDAQTPSPPAPLNEKLPPEEGNVLEALAKSPRHGEYVNITAGGQPIKTWVVYPERKDKAPVVIVIHEIFGLTDWIRGVADQLAKEGFIAVAPDLISGKGPNGGATDSVASRDDVTALVRALPSDEVTTRLDAVRDYAIKLPSATGKTATIGYCWGGSTSFAYATRQAGLNAAVVYYGTSPEAPALAAIHAPVLGLYGADDARVNVTIEPASQEMKRLGKSYEYHLYDGAGHGFLRQQTGRDGANMRATEQAWPATLAFIRQYTN